MFRPVQPDRRPLPKPAHARCDGVSRSRKTGSSAEVLRLAGYCWESEERRRFRNRNIGTSPMAGELIIGEMSTSQVAARLGISCLAVTKRASALGGRKIGHQWMFEATTVTLAAREREERINGSTNTHTESFIKADSDALGPDPKLEGARRRP